MIKNKKRKRKIFRTLFLFFIFSSSFFFSSINALGYEEDEDVSLNNDGSMDMTLGGYGEFKDNENDNTYASTQTPKTYIPNDIPNEYRYDYRDTRIKVYPKEYWNGITSGSDFSYSSTQLKSFDKSGYTDFSNIRAEAKKVHHKTGWHGIVIDENLDPDYDWYDRQSLYDGVTDYAYGTVAGYKDIEKHSVWIDQTSTISSTTHFALPINPRDNYQGWQSQWSNGMLRIRVTICHEKESGWGGLGGFALGQHAKFKVQIGLVDGFVENYINLFNVEKNSDADNRIDFSDLNSGTLISDESDEDDFRIWKTYEFEFSMSRTLVDQMHNYATYIADLDSGNWQSMMALKVHAYSKLWMNFKNGFTEIGIHEIDYQFEYDWERSRGGSPMVEPQFGIGGTYKSLINPTAITSKHPDSTNIAFTTGKTSYFNLIRVYVDYVSATYYTTSSDVSGTLSLNGHEMSSEPTYWIKSIGDLKDSNHFIDEGGGKGYIPLSLSLSNTVYDGFYYDYTIDIDTILISDTIDYLQGSGSYSYSYDYLDLTIYYTSLTLEGAYIDTLLLNNGDSLTPSRNDLDDDNPLTWENNIDDIDKEANGIPDPFTLDIDFTTYTDTPNLIDWGIPSGDIIQDIEPYEFYLETTDNIAIENYPFIIFEDVYTHDRSIFDLNLSSLNLYWRQNEFGMLPPSNYSVWYGAQNIVGNYHTTPAFDLEVNATKVIIYNININDYALGTTGNLLTFKMHSPHPNKYWVKIDGSEVVSDTTWQNDQLIEVSIDTYGLGTHNVEIIANGENLVNTTETTEFLVYSKPTFDTEPASKSYVDLHGEFNLTWQVSDDNLKNYTITRDNSLIAFDDSLSGDSAEITYTDNSTELAKESLKTYTYQLKVWDEDNKYSTSYVFIDIEEYQSPTPYIEKPDYTQTEATDGQDIEVGIDFAPDLEDAIEIKNVYWDIRKDSDPYDWKPLAYTSNIWTGSFDPMNYKTGEYNICIKVEDAYQNNSIKQAITLNQLVSYDIPEEEIIRPTDNIYVSSYSDISDVINAYVNITHNPTVLEENFEMILPNRYDDDNLLQDSYYLFRGFTRYRPSLQYTEYHTVWKDIPYREKSQVFFTLDSPEISYGVTEHDESTDVYTIPFDLSSKHNFTNLRIHNILPASFDHPDHYIYELEYLYDTNWIPITDLDVEYTRYPEIEWDLSSIEDTTMELRFIVKPKVRIHNVALEDYNFGTEGNTLNFSLSGGSGGHYNVTIDNGTLITDNWHGTWDGEESFSFDIDGYGISPYNVIIWANDSIGTENTWTGSFVVAKLPTLTSKPSNQTYIDRYGEFTLTWKVEDNGLENYTIYRNATILEEREFTNKKNATISLTNNTSELECKLYNYTIIIRDDEGVSIQHSVFITIIAYEDPSITIENPIESMITSINNQSIDVNVTKLDVLSIESVSWDLIPQGTSTYEWKTLTYNGFTDLYEGEFSPLDYEYGEYELWIRVVDEYDTTNKSKLITLHQNIPYYFTYSNTTRTYSDITISHDYLQTTSINGEVNVSHNTLVRERDFEVYLPTEYSDAFDYRLFRGTYEYTPSNSFETSAHTIWNLPDYRKSDLIQFRLAKPTLTNKNPTEDGLGKITAEFSVYSRHYFENITIHNKIQKYMDYPDKYDYTLYYFYDGGWVEIDKSTYNIMLGNYIEFYLEWDNINTDQLIKFKYEAIPIQEEVKITNLEVEDYEVNTTEHYLNFTLEHDHPDSYDVRIDGTLVATDDTWEDGDTIEISIDGYDIGVHNFSIYADSSFGLPIQYNGTFRVYQTPVFTIEQNNCSFINLYGNFTLGWGLTDNGLENYTLYRDNNTLLQEGNFSDPYFGEVSITQDTTNLTLGTHNYTLSVYDNDTLTTERTVFVDIIAYEHPTISLNIDDNTTITSLGKRYVRANISSQNLLSIENVSWDLRNATEPDYDWKEATNDWYEWNFTLNPTEYEYGTYTLGVMAQDQYHNTVKEITLNLELILTYRLSKEEITFSSDNFTVSADGENEYKDAKVTITHNSSIKERDFIVYLPEEFSDATDYKIYRGTATIRPTGNYIGEFSRRKTEWHLDDFKEQDVIHFKIRTVAIQNKLPTTNDNDVIQMEFTLLSYHDFTNITFENEIRSYISGDLGYSIKLEKLYQGNWTEISNVSMIGSYAGKTTFTFFIDEINAGEKTEYRVSLIPSKTGEEGGSGALIMGIIGAVSIPALFIILTFKSKVMEGSRKDKLKWLGIYLGLGVAGFFTLFALFGGFSGSVIRFTSLLTQI